MRRGHPGAAIDRARWWRSYLRSMLGSRLSPFALSGHLRRYGSEQDPEALAGRIAARFRAERGAEVVQNGADVLVRGGFLRTRNGSALLVVTRRLLVEVTSDEGETLVKFTLDFGELALVLLPFAVAGAAALAGRPSVQALAFLVVMLAWVGGFNVLLAWLRIRAALVAALGW